MSTFTATTKKASRATWTHAKRTVIYGLTASVVFSSFAQGGEVGKTLADANTSYVQPTAAVGGLVIATVVDATGTGIKQGINKLRQLGDDK